MSTITDEPISTQLLNKDHIENIKFLIDYFSKGHPKGNTRLNVDNIKTKVITGKISKKRI